MPLKKSSNNSSLIRQKKKNLWLYRSTLQNSFAIPPHYPLEISLEVTNDCNVRCTMCARSQPGVMKKYPQMFGQTDLCMGEISNDILEKVYPGFEYALILNTFGFGEPLLYSRFLPLLERAKDAKLFINFFTNGTLLTTDISRNLVELKVDQMYHSLSAATAETYSHIHIGGSLNEVLENIWRLDLLKRISGFKLPRVYINFIAMEDNLEELPQLIKTIVRYGIEGIDIKPLMVYNDEMRKYYRRYQPERDDPILQESKDLARYYGLSLNANSFYRTLTEREETFMLLRDLKDDENQRDRNGPPIDRRGFLTPQKGFLEEIDRSTFCTYPFRSIYVRWDGSVRPDCFGGPIVGDLRYQPLQEVWYSEAFRKMRIGVYQGRYPPECAFCLTNHLRDGFENYDEILHHLFPGFDLPGENSLEEHQERYIPGVGSAETAYEHIARYKFALQYIDKKAVLDIGCGTGYGSRIIASAASKVVGIDISEEGINFARRNFSADNIYYLIGNIIHMPFPAKSFEYAVCFETIEHIAEVEEFLKEVCRVLSNEGVLIVSTPDKKIYSEGRRYLNPYHKNEMYEEEFYALLRRYFSEFEIYRQGIVTGNLIWKEGSGSDNRNMIEQVEVGNCHQSTLPEFYAGPNPIMGPYLIAVCRKDKGIIKEKNKDSFLYLDSYNRAITEKSFWIGKLERQKKEISTQLKEQGAYLEKVHKTLNQRDLQLTRANARWQHQGKYIEKVHATLELRDEQLKKLNSLFIVRLYRRIRALLKIPLE